MKISIKVKPNARKNEVTKTEDNLFLVSVNVPPADGKANEKVIELLSDYFDKPKRAIRIISGFSSKKKILEIE
ncbi:MAG: DUF167 domain-containing protein [Ignavibacteriae bacterium]|nr:DUF167 domain-containing protein [Ignavibacteriota bacterium]